jgi:tetratricopeptide (TPR) repeat protein
MALFNAAVNSLQARRVPQALALLREAARRYSDTEVGVLARFGLGETFASVGFLDEACEAFEDVHRANPGHPLARTALAHVIRYREARADFRGAAQAARLLFDHAAPARKAEFHLRAILLHESAGQMQQVVRLSRGHLERYRAEAPRTRIQVLVAFGRAAAALGQESDAKSVWARAIRLFERLDASGLDALSYAAFVAVADARFRLASPTLSAVTEARTLPELKAFLGKHAGAIHLLEAVAQQGPPRWAVRARVLQGMAFEKLRGSVLRLHGPGNPRAPVVLQVIEGAIVRIVLHYHALRLRRRAVDYYMAAVDTSVALRTAAEIADEARLRLLALAPWGRVAVEYRSVESFMGHQPYPRFAGGRSASAAERRGYR